MDQSILWQCYQSLSKQEEKQLGNWIVSPFFNRSDSLVALHNYLKNCRQSKQVPEKQTAMQLLQLSQETQLRLLMSALLDQLEHFLSYQELFAQPENSQIALATAYRKRGLSKPFQRSLQRASTLLEAQPFRHAPFLQAQAAIELERYHHQSSLQRMEAFNLQQLLDRTEHAFLATQLRQACFARSHQAVYKTHYEFGALPLILQQLTQKPDLLQIPAIGLYYYCFQFLSDPAQASYFQAFRTLLQQTAHQLPTDILRELHLMAINYGIRKINQYETQYLKDTLNLYQSALQTQLLIENGFLSPYSYNNITAIALKVGELAWVEQFVQEYAPLLEKKHQNANYQLNLARIAYYKKQYTNALHHLQSADYKDLINNLIAKTLLIKIYYETDEWEVLEAHLQSMQVFLRRQKVIGYHLDNYQNIIRFSKKLISPLRRSPEATEVLRLQIQTSSPLTERDWFLEMLENP